MKLASQDFQRAITRNLIAAKYLPNAAYGASELLQGHIPYVKLLAEDERLEYNCEAVVQFRYLLLSAKWLGVDECQWKWGLVERWQRFEWFYRDQIKDSYRAVTSHYPHAILNIITQDERVHLIDADFDFRSFGERQNNLIWDICYFQECTSSTVESDPLKSLALPLEQLRVFSHRIDGFHQEFRQLLTE